MTMHSPQALERLSGNLGLRVRTANRFLSSLPVGTQEASLLQAVQVQREVPGRVNASVGKEFVDPRGGCR